MILVNILVILKILQFLTAAGTSMENGAHGGKTRTELWQSYEEEINAI